MCSRFATAALIGLLAAGCRTLQPVPIAEDSESSDDPDGGTEHAVLTAHFFIRWSKGQAAPAEVHAVQERACLQE